MLTFAVLGDTHYRSDRQHRLDTTLHQGTADEPGLEGLTTVNYPWMVKHVWPAVLNEVREHDPDLVCQIGDFVDGGHDDYERAAAEMRETLDLLSSLECPVFIARGTHEGMIPRPGGYAFHRIVIPHLAKHLGRPLDKAYYSFNAGGCHFIMLDYMTLREGDEQHRWMEADLAGAGDQQHVFLFAHPPLVPIGRAFFSRLEFIQPVLGSLACYPVDAYFCGHTHHQAVTLHRSGERWFLQAMGTIIGFPEAEPNPLERVRALLPPADDVEYYWGFQEDTAPSWFLVQVDGQRVRLDWHLLHRGVQGTVEWEVAGRITRVVKPDLPRPFVAATEDLQNIVSGRLYITGFAPGDPTMRVLLNGAPIGSVPQSRGFGPARGGWGFIRIPADRLGAIGVENELVVHNPEGGHTGRRPKGTDQRRATPVCHVPSLGRLGHRRAAARADRRAHSRSTHLVEGTMREDAAR
jgi:hypothetical protein